MQRVHLNKDVPAIGCGFSYQNASETVCAICSPLGAFLGSMRTERIRTFQLRHYGSLDLDDFGSLLDTRMASSLTSALTIILDAMSVASPFDFNLKMKHCCVSMAESAELCAHLDAFSFVWQGSGYCHPESLHGQMLKTL